jgi:hypothetical protein
MKGKREKMFRPILRVLITTLISVSVSTVLFGETSDLVLTNVRIYTVNEARPWAQAVANLAPHPVVVAGATYDTGFGIGDIAVSPAILGWHWRDFHVQGGYYAFLPTGKFNLGASDNVGKGFWTHMFALGWTWMPAEDRPWHASLMTRYEVHSNQKDRDVTPGDTLTLELGLGKKVSDTIEAGVVGHIYRQVTGTTDCDAVNPLKYRSNGIGAEIQYLIANRLLASPGWL